MRRPYRNLANRSAPLGLDLLGFHRNVCEGSLCQSYASPAEIYVDRKDFFIIIAKNVLMENPLDESGGFPYT